MISETPASISVNVDGQPHEVFMSYGLLTELTRLVPNLDNIPGVVLDGESRDAFMSALLSKRNKAGRVTEKVDPEDAFISIPDCEALLEWAQDHLLGFFLRRAQKAQLQVTATMTALEQSSSAGTPA